MRDPGREVSGRDSINAVDGIPVETTDADGHSTLSIVDALGRTSATVDAMGTMTCFDYGPFGELEAVTRNCAYGASGPVETSTYDYDSSSRLTEWDEPARGVQQYTYTGYDELETLTDANGNVIEHVYDEIGRLRIRRSPGCTGRWSFDEELIGALAFQQSEDGVRQSFAYDEFGRVERTEYDVPGVAPQGPWAFEFGYTVQGQLGSITYPTGLLSPMGAGAPATLQVAFGYDDADHLRSIRGVGRTLWGLNSANASGQPLVETFNIDSSPQPIQTKTSTYHAFTQRIESIEVEADGAVVQDFAYGWSPGGNLQSRSEQTTGQSETFGYDVLDRLTSIDGNQVASYDALGNFTGRDGVGNYGYQANGRLDWYGDPSNTVKHDANGNVTSIGDLELTWNAFDQVEQITGPGEQLDFAYDADGQRVARFDGSGFTLTLGGLFELDVDGSDRRARYFVPAGDSVVEVRDTELSPGAWDREVRYQYSDHLGSGSVLVNDDGTVEQRVSYDAWGQARDWLQWNQSFDPNLLEEFASGYTGHQPELDAGLINMRGRMYSPEIARFLSVDPVVEGMGDAQTWNAYSYVLNNPLRFTDPSGFRACELDICNAIAGGGDLSGGSGWDGVGRGANGKGTDDAAGQSLPGQSSGQTGNNGAGTANNAGGNGGQSGMPGSQTNPNDRGEADPLVYYTSPFVRDVVVPASPPHPSSWRPSWLPSTADMGIAGDYLEYMIGESHGAGTVSIFGPLSFIPGLVDTSSGAYETGEVVGVVASLAVGAGELSYGAWRLGLRYFGRAAAKGGAPPGSAGAMRRMLFEGNPKHGAVARGRASAAPKNGQAALDTSLDIGQNTTRRVGIDYDAGEFVVFDEHVAGTFHGHVRSWGDLSQRMQSALRKAGTADGRGRILTD